MVTAILLTVHNRCEKTLKCLHSLVQQTGFSTELYDIYLVDDGCTDQTNEDVSKSFPFVHIIKGDGSLFWNRGMLLAWETAAKTKDYDGFLWLNDDVVLLPDTLTTLNKYSQKHPDSIIVGAMGGLTDANEITYSGYVKNRTVKLEPQDKELECDCFNGNVVLVPSVVCNKIGMLDPYFRHSCGDFEYGYRAKKAGIKSYVIPVVGRCDRNPGNPKWLSKELSVRERFKKLYSPLGNNPCEEFRVTKYESFLSALGLFIYLNLCACFPSLSKQNKQ